jgi:hypothetical protein
VAVLLALGVAVGADVGVAVGVAPPPLEPPAELIAASCELYVCQAAAFWASAAWYWSQIVAISFWVWVIALARLLMPLEVAPAAVAHSDRE